MKARLLRVLFLFCLSIGLVTACNGTPFGSSKPEAVPLRVTYSLWSGYYPLVIAQEKGFFTQQGVKVEPVYIENYIASVSDFSAGQGDGIAMTLGGVMNIIGKNSDVQAVLVTDESAGADVVVAEENIHNVADLKGKRLGTRLGDFGELFITTMLEKNQLTTDDVTLINLEGEVVPTRLKSGEIQAGHTWEPYADQAVSAGAKILFTSQQTPGLIPSLIVFRSKVLQDRPKDIQAFVRAWFQGQDYWKTNPQESKVLIAKALKIKPEEVSAEGDRLYTLQDNLKAFTPSSNPESLYHTAKVYADFFIRTGGLSSTPDIEKLLVPSFVQQLQAGS